jgi:hypothetical protein
MQAYLMQIRILACLALALPASARPGGPEPVLAYDFCKAAVVTGEKPALKPRFSPTLELSALPLDQPAIGKDLRFAGAKDPNQLAATSEELAKLLPQRESTLAAWLTIDQPTPYGAVFSALDGKGGAERGLALGYNGSKPHAVLATQGGDDGDGNNWKTPIKRATLGDTKSQPLVQLDDKHGVDLVWCGHVHSYERTWLIRGGKPVEKDGTLYMVTGGALEGAGPYRTGVQRHVRHGHHFCYVTINGGEFDIKACDLEGRLFGQATLRK